MSTRYQARISGKKHADYFGYMLYGNGVGSKDSCTLKFCFKEELAVNSSLCVDKDGQIVHKDTRVPLILGS